MLAAGIRIDSKTLSQSELNQQAQEYDPRKHKIPHGIRNEWFKGHFSGQGISLAK